MPIMQTDTSTHNRTILLLTVANCLIIIAVSVFKLKIKMIS